MHRRDAMSVVASSPRRQTTRRRRSLAAAVRIRSHHVHGWRARRWGCAALAVAFAAAGCDLVIDRQIERGLTARADRSVLEAPGIHVVLCGTGSPLPDKERAGACTAVLAGG